MQRLAKRIFISFDPLLRPEFRVNKLNIAPKYASIREGVQNGIGNTAGIPAPPIFLHVDQSYQENALLTVATIQFHLLRF